MTDRYGREIDYLRISITDRCNLRCRYCMPEGLAARVAHSDVLRYEELVRLALLFAKLGISRLRITGGEPLMRKGAAELVAALKMVPGIRTVTLTTNGTLLAAHAAALKAAGLDGVNISLDTDDGALAAAIAGVAGTVPAVLAGIEAMREAGIPVKLNAVLLRDTAPTLPRLLRFAQQGVPVRFIELMPVGYGKEDAGISAEEALRILTEEYPDLRPTASRLGAGPAHYYESSRLSAPVGVIDAVSRRFCGSCNRVRLTSTGVLKPCLCFEEGIDLAALLRGGAADGEILEAIGHCIMSKPRQHCFDAPLNVTETKPMSEIGG